jgi:hypothetical protein
VSVSAICVLRCTATCELRRSATRELRPGAGTHRANTGTHVYAATGAHVDTATGAAHSTCERRRRRCQYSGNTDRAQSLKFGHVTPPLIFMEKQQEVRWIVPG